MLMDLMQVRIFLQQSFFIALWENSKEVETVKWIQARSGEENTSVFESDNYALSEDEEEQPREEKSSNSEVDEEDASSSGEENTAAFGNKFSALNVSN